MSRRLVALMMAFVGIGVGSTAPMRAADRRNDLLCLAAFLSEGYQDASKITRISESGGRKLLKKPLPPIEPGRDKSMQRHILSQLDTEAGAKTMRAWLKFQLTLAIIEERNRATGTAGATMDERTMKRIVEKVKDDAGEMLADIWANREVPGATVEEWEDAFRDANEDLQQWIHEFWKVGRSQMDRYFAQNQLQAKLQEVWNERPFKRGELDVYAELEKVAGPEFQTPALALARTQLVVETGAGPAAVWRGLCVTNTSNRDLTNVTLDIDLSAGPDDRLRRTWFFPALKPKQTFLLHISDRVFGQGGHSTQAANLLARFRVLSDQGRQEPRSFKLSKNGRGHLAKGTVTPQLTEETAPRIDTAAFFQSLADERKAITVRSRSGKKQEQLELQFAKATEPLLSYGGKVLVHPEQYLRITITDSEGNSIELDGHPEPVEGKIVLLSHLNVNGAVEPVARQFDKHHGTLTVDHGKITLLIHKATYVAPAADAGARSTPSDSERAGEGGAVHRKRETLKTPNTKASPTLAGTWAATFRGGARADFTFSPDGKFVGTNGVTGTWSQDGRKVSIVARTKADDDVIWQGDIDVDGRKLTASSARGGRVTATRK